MKFIAALLVLAASPAFAGERFCNDGLPYEVEIIPHGFAVVRANSAEYCKRIMNFETGELSKRYICDGQDDYQLDFDIDGDELILTYTDGNDALLYRCK